MTRWHMFHEWNCALPREAGRQKDTLRGKEKRLRNPCESHNPFKQNRSRCSPAPRSESIGILAERKRDICSTIDERHPGCVIGRTAHKASQHARRAFGFCSAVFDVSHFNE
jgi:hypothetical protein